MDARVLFSGNGNLSTLAVLLSQHSAFSENVQRVHCLLMASMDSMRFSWVTRDFHTGV